MENKDYLGDGLYVGIEHGMVVLYTTDGETITNEIFLEPEVLGAFLRYLERLKKINRKDE